jgi:hypothetical protein
MFVPSFALICGNDWLAGKEDRQMDGLDEIKRVGSDAALPVWGHALRLARYIRLLT